ncbi:tetratricopeptide repeat protein [Sphingomonas sp.]|uniref:tetratricopeptide repeat protein n=1 Tax=Sphingomonas sp. TaxID=28214 RepID=UPI002E0F09E3|nr:tetratricopeptide repeat protein [Sphingomonas sp.]
MIAIAALTGAASAASGPPSRNRVAALEEAGRYRDAEAIRRQQLAATDGQSGEDAARALENLANNLGMQSRGSEAAPYIRRALQIRLKIAGEAQSRAQASQRAAAASLNQFSGMLADAGSLDEAERAARRALDMYRIAGDADTVAYADTRVNLGGILAMRGEITRADGEFRAAVASLKQREESLHRIKPQPGVIEAAELDRAARSISLSKAIALNNLAINLHRIALARTIPSQFRQSYMHRNAMLAPIPSGAGGTVVGIDPVARDAMLREATGWFEESLDRRRQLFGRNHLDTANAMNSLAANYVARGKRAEAMALYRQALATKLKFLSPGDRDLTLGYWGLASIVDAPSEARSLYRLAARSAFAGQARFKEFDPAATSELRSQRPIFLGAVRANWAMVTEAGSTQGGVGAAPR